MFIVNGLPSCLHCAGQDAGRRQGYSARCTLGKMVAPADEGPNIAVRSVHYRCEAT